MKDEANKVRVQVMVDAEIVERIDELAELLGGSRSGLTARLIEEALNDNEWIIRHIAAPMRKMLESWKTPNTKRATS